MTLVLASSVTVGRFPWRWQSTNAIAVLPGGCGGSLDRAGFLEEEEQV